MPRDGSNVYSKASASFVPSTIISSAAVNADIDDLVTDANTARAIVAGGTGQTTALGAHDALVIAGSTVASAATVALDAVVGPLVDISGTAAITAITLGNGKCRFVRATGAFVLTASAGLIVNGSNSVAYTAAADDLFMVQAYAGVQHIWKVGGNAPYLPLAGGTLTGGLTGTALTLSGVATVNGTGTSTIAGPLDVSGASAGQIKFPATQNASANANTLDDYKEAIAFTPTITFGGAAVGQTYSVRSGQAVKIGNIVLAYGTVIMTAKGSSTGAAKLEGLPYTTANNAAHGAITPIGSTFTGLTAGLGFNGGAGSATMSIVVPISAGAANATDANFNNASSFYFTVIYTV
jgi:hypothetical protein